MVMAMASASTAFFDSKTTLRLLSTWPRVWLPSCGEAAGMSKVQTEPLPGRVGGGGRRGGGVGSGGGRVGDGKRPAGGGDEPLRDGGAEAGAAMRARRA